MATGMKHAVASSLAHTQVTGPKRSKGFFSDLKQLKIYQRWLQIGVLRGSLGRRKKRRRAR
eukprot:9135202-Lingulodinium_polyedra.AAC.1